MPRARSTKLDTATEYHWMPWHFTSEIDSFVMFDDSLSCNLIKRAELLCLCVYEWQKLCTVPSIVS